MDKIDEGGGGGGGGGGGAFITGFYCQKAVQTDDLSFSYISPTSKSLKATISQVRLHYFPSLIWRTEDHKL
jgi:hypothetical protein